MKRVEALMGRELVTYPEDVLLIQAHVQWADATHLEIEGMWEKWSEHLCAGWMTVDAETLKEFAEWLQEDVYV